MSTFTMCPVCGSDWCSGVECLREKHRIEVQALTEEIQRLRTELNIMKENYENLHARELRGEQFLMNVKSLLRMEK